MRPILRVVSSLLAAACLASSCASVPYSYDQRLYRGAPREMPPAIPQVEHGRPNAFFDGVGWVLGIPGKILLWDSRIDNHHPTPPTEQAVRAFLEANRLGKVKVRINQYAPGGEFRRLVQNKEVGAGWRYSVGLVAWLFYTVLPGRVFGGDNFNPYTNTVSLYSDIPAVALHEGGHAKDLAERKWKGTYSFLYMIPLVPLLHEKAASDDAVSYLREKGDVEGEKAAYRILYPAYGTYVGGSFSQFLPGLDLALMAATVIPGHIIGRWKAAHLEETIPGAAQPGR